ncbi:MAG: hypothetical protein IJW63_01110 [Lachnospiraceae bacterium]|nr:hypothetical protein [Lachnospiraceae bacterium]
MKFVKWISLFFIDALIFFCIGFYYGMKTENFFYPGSKTNETYQSPHIIREESDAEPVAVEEECITKDTRYTVKSVVMPDEDISSETIAVPEQYIGMNRETFLVAMENYSLVPPTEEREKGFVNVEVESFSSSQVKITMYYENPEIKNFFLAVFDHQVIVYEEDKTTIFMRTGIHLEDLPEEIQMKLIAGMTLETEEELYNFLESYSS